MDHVTKQIRELEQSLDKLRSLQSREADPTLVRNTERELDMLMDNLPDNIYFKDSQSRYVRLNKSMANLLQIENPAQALGKTVKDFFRETSVRQIYAREKSVLETGIPQIAKDELVETKDGKKIWFSTTTLPLWNNKGEIEGTFGLSRDINHLKNIEHKLQNANLLLEQKVKERTAELTRANLGLEVRLQQLDFLNKKSHFFSQVMDLESLQSVVFFAFQERYPHTAIHMSIYQGKQFKSLFSTELLKTSQAEQSLLEALDFVETNNQLQLSFDSDWTKNHLLQNLLPKELKSHPFYLLVPLVVEKRVRGMIQILGPVGFDKIFEREEPVLNTLGMQAAIALDSASHYKQLSDNSRIQSQLELAKKIQEQFLPKEPNIPGYSITGVCHSANAVGGDYLDFFKNDVGCWVLVIGDVCGKGIPAALVMTSLRSSMRAEARTLTSSKELMMAVNELMGDDLRADYSFITCLCLVIEHSRERINYTRAGHPHLIATRNNQPEAITISPPGIALGMVPGENFSQIVEEVEVPLAPGEMLIAHTDGLDETLNSKKENYGFDRLLKVISQGKESDPHKLVSNILTDVKTFSEGYPQFDDLTLFALKKL